MRRNIAKPIVTGIIAAMVLSCSACGNGKDNSQNSDNGSSNVPVTIEFGIGRKYRRHMLYLRYRGKELDPTRNEETDEWSALILERLGLSPTWSYRSKKNRISMLLKQPEKIHTLVYIFYRCNISSYCRSRRTYAFR